MDNIVSISIYIIIFMIIFVGISSALEGRFGKAKRLVEWVIFLICLFAILAETVLFRHPTAYMSYDLEPFYSYRKAFAGERYYQEELFLNILLYIPFGFMLKAVFRKTRFFLLLLGTLGLSALTECIQLVGRLGVFEFDDIWNNTLGGLIGMLAFMLLIRLRDRMKN